MENSYYGLVRETLHEHGFQDKELASKTSTLGKKFLSDEELSEYILDKGEGQSPRYELVEPRWVKDRLEELVEEHLRGQFHKKTRPSSSKNLQSAMLSKHLLQARRIAQEILQDWEEDTRLSKDDLISAGYEVIAEQIASKTLGIGNLDQALRTRMKRELIVDRLDEQTLMYNTDLAQRVYYVGLPPQSPRRDDAVDRILQVLSRISSRDANIFARRNGLQGHEPQTLQQIGDAVNLSRERIRGIEKEVYRKLAILGEHADLDTLFEEIAAYVPKRPSELRPDKSLEKSVVKKKIARAVGPLTNFRERYEVSRSQFASYVQAVYSHMGLIDCAQLVRIYEEERAIMPLQRRKKIQTLDQLKRAATTVEALVQKEGRKDLVDQVKAMYFPLFAASSTQCLEILEDECTSPKNSPAVQTVFLQAYEFFSNARALSVPGMITKLDDYQKVDVTVLSGTKAHLIGSEMGTGKTLEAIAYAQVVNANRIMVIATKSGAQATWIKQINKHLAEPGKVVFATSQRLRANLAGIRDAKWTVVTYQGAMRNINRLRKIPFDLIIADECHNINQERSGQSAAVTSLEAPRKLAMSGHLFKNRREELFSVLHWLWPKDFPLQDRFLDTFCSDADGLARLQYELRSRVLVRYRADVLNLPPRQDFPVRVQLTPSQRRRYDAIEANFIQWYIDNKGESEELSGSTLHKLHYLRKAALLAKLRVVGGLAERLVANGEKAVIYTTYISMAKKFASRLSEQGICYIDGTLDSYERKQQVEAFHDDPSRKIFVVTAAGAESIDLTPASYMIFANKPLTAADEGQTISRVSRRGQTKPIQVYHVIADGTVDENIEKLIERKRIEYELAVRNKQDYVRWFEEVQSENVRDLVRDLVVARTS